MLRASRQSLPTGSPWLFKRRGNTESLPLRTSTDPINRVPPLMITLTPTSVPITRAELDGHCKKDQSPSMGAMIPSNKIQAGR
jgi:hypothetical protein